MSRGPWVQRQPGKRITAETYHLFRDCSRFVAYVGEEGVERPSDAFQAFDISDLGRIADITELFGIRACKQCLARRDRKTVHEVLNGILPMAGLTAAVVLEALAQEGYVIVRKKVSS